MITKMIPKILFVARDDGGCGFFRCVQPAAFLKRAGLAETEVALKFPTEQQLLSADLVIMQEMGSVNGSNIAKFLAERRIPFAAEFDDFVQHVSPRNTAGYPAWNPSTLYTYRAMELARNAIGMTVSTPQLAREYFAYNQSIYVIPNWLDKEKWENPIYRREDGKVRIGWCGGNAHGDDLMMISKVLDRIIKERKGKVVFETLGMTRKELQGNLSMISEFSETCPACGYEGGIHHYPGESLQDYPFVLAQKGWDIAVAPVINNSFGNCKSDLKIKEYAAVGLPIVASPIKPYLDAVKSYAQACFAETFDEWYNALTELIDNQKLRDEMTRKNREWTQNNWIQNHIQEIFDAYRQLIQKAEAIFGTKTR